MSGPRVWCGRERLCICTKGARERETSNENGWSKVCVVSKVVGAMRSARRKPTGQDQDSGRGWTATGLDLGRTQIKAGLICPSKNHCAVFVVVQWISHLSPRLAWLAWLMTGWAPFLGLAPLVRLPPCYQLGGERRRKRKADAAVEDRTPVQNDKSSDGWRKGTCANWIAAGMDEEGVGDIFLHGDSQVVASWEV